MTTFEIAGSLESMHHRESRLWTDLGAPLPLGHGNALQMGLLLRSRDLSYPAISVVVGQYHGFHRSAGWWRHQLVLLGADRRPRGIPLASAA